MKVYKVKKGDTLLETAFKKSPIIEIDGQEYMHVKSTSFSAEDCRECAFRSGETWAERDCDCPLGCDIVGHVEKADPVYVDLLKAGEMNNENTQRTGH